MQMTQNEALELIVKTLDSKKAEDIKVIKIKELSVLADYFVIAMVRQAPRPGRWRTRSSSG